MKRLVVCCDGSWDQVSSPANVAKLALAIAPNDEVGAEQRVMYSAGITTNTLRNYLAPVFSSGLGRRTMDCYRFLVENYEQGDAVFLLGGSNGATVARSLAGMVDYAGVLPRERAHLIDEAYQIYRSRSDNRDDAEFFRRAYSHDIEIQFLGVFDTVGTLGAPTLLRRYQFHDKRLPRSVRSAYQALAIDERRAAFRPALWEPPTTPQTEVLDQVWFTGVHGDVVGGYADSVLADIPLQWMAGKLRLHGIALKPNLLEGSGSIPIGPDRSLAVHPDALGVMHNSRTGVYRLLAPHDRDLIGVAGGSVDSSVIERYEKIPTYRPPGLVKWMSQRPSNSSTRIEDLE